MKTDTVFDQWAALESFLLTCTDVEPEQLSATLHLHAEPATRSFLDSAVRRATELFGPKPANSDAFGGSEQSWELAAGALPPALRFIADGEPWAYDVLAPVSLSILTPLRFRDPITRAIFPHQPRPASFMEGADCSQLYISLGPLGHALPKFRFPFTEVGASFLRFLGVMAAAVPFRLGAAHFTHAVPLVRDAYTRRRLTAKERALVKATLARPNSRGIAPRLKD